jgi:hypothetical protein
VRQFIEIVPVIVQRPGQYRIAPDSSPKLVEQKTVFINIDHIIAFGMKQEAGELNVGYIQMALGGDEWDLSYQVTPDSITRLREVLQ